MTSRTAVCEGSAPADSSCRDLAARPPGLLTLLVLSAWCGLVAGLLEVGTILLHRLVTGSNSLYWTTRHFVWLLPLIDLTIFVFLGVGLAVIAWCSRRRGYWLAARLLAR